VGPRELAEQCARAVMETVPRVVRAIREEARRGGAPLLTIPQLRTLGFLDRQPGACLGHLAEHLGVSVPTASTLVDRLVGRDLLTRTQDPRERRRLVLALTPLGARHLRRARQSAHAWIAATLAHLPPDTLRCISQGVTKLGEAFQAPTRDSGRPGTAAPGGKAVRLRASVPAPRNGQRSRRASAGGHPGTAGRGDRSRSVARGRGGVA
jgi:DNA-binding MarR family transcriptional regulator